MKVNLAIPVADQRRAYDFYRALGLTVANPNGDDMPEPPLFALNGETTLMLVPTTGFGWVLAGNQVAAPGTSECVLGTGVPTAGEVDAWIVKARAAGATVVAEPAQQRWGYSGSFRDPDGHTWLVVQQ